MKKYRKQIINRIIILIDIAVLLIVAYLIIRFNNLSLNSDMQGFQNGFVFGFIIAIIIIVIALVLRIKNDEKLKEHAIAVKDERNIEIMYETTSRSLYTIFLLVAFLTMISSCISEIITGTLVVVLFSMVIIIGTNYFIVNKKY